jgi:hypothetical protein
MKRANCLPRCPEQASASPIDSEWFSPMATSAMAQDTEESK